MNGNIRPYVVINGNSSRMIQGLIITDLPPITKPKMRTKAETVDGRDGDIVTTLGFSAYDKELKIGLSYDYDIDEIIAFFTTSGRVVFSNEPDKYYNFALYDKIDFEKLFRFKKAKVNFHCQPFKFSDSEGEETFTFTGNAGEIKTRNNGNYFSRPTMAITGAGDVKIYINSALVLNVAFGAEKTIVFDAENMNAISLDGSTYYNRLVVGNYDNIKLNIGSNLIAFEGNVQQITIKNRSRWL